MNIDLLYPAFVGLLLGSMISFIFNLNSQRTVSKFSVLIFGYESDLLIKMILLFTITAGIAGLAGMSMMVRDVDYPKQHLSSFILETFVASVFPAFLLLVMTYLRGQTFTGYTFLDFLLLAAKFGILHVLLQFSGVYSSVFPPK
jgi:hypothetical protein